MLGKVLYRTATEECAINNDIDTKNNNMTAAEFNNKYKDYLEKGHYGADGFDDPKFL